MISCLRAKFVTKRVIEKRQGKCKDYKSHVISMIYVLDKNLLQRGKIK
jgi:hypothetical protein